MGRVKDKINMVDAINQALYEEMERDGDVVILGEDVGEDGGVFRVTAGLLERYGKERVMDTPLSELGITGTAIGMSLYGLRPVVEIQFMGFIYGAIEQIYSHATRMRSRSRGRYSAPIVVRTPYGIGIKGPEMHAESSEALLCHMPGLKVVVPSNPYSAKGLLKSAIRDPDPVVFLEPSRLYRSIKAELREGDDYTIEIGKADLFQEGGDLTIVAWGSMLHRAAEASEGLDAEIIDLMTLRPFDEEAVLESVKKTGRLVIVHESTKYCALGAEISALVAEEAMLSLKAPIKRVAAPDGVLPMAALEEEYLPPIELIRSAYEDVLRY